jgi:Uma2 family endonuclease
MSQSSAKQKLMSVEEYLAFEEKSKRKYEYMDGEIFAMAGATRKHSKIASNIGIELGSKLKGKGCEVHFGDLRIKASERQYVYGDVTIFCDNSEFETYKETEILLTPKIVFEVLSKSTEARDRGDKAQDYRRLPSLTDYILVSQKRIFVEHFVRQSDGSWKLFEYNQLTKKLKLDAINSELSLADIYFEVNIPQINLF